MLRQVTREENRFGAEVRARWTRHLREYRGSHCDITIGKTAKISSAGKK